jgi:hypothetical protein
MLVEALQAWILKQRVGLWRQCRPERNRARIDAIDVNPGREP